MKSFGHHEDYALLSRLRRGENRSAWTKTSYARERTNNKHNPHIVWMQGLKRRPCCGGQVLSPLCHPCFPSTLTAKQRSFSKIPKSVIVQINNYTFVIINLM